MMPSQPRSEIGRRRRCAVNVSRAGVVLAALGLVGCAVQPPVERPHLPTAPETWTATPGGAASASPTVREAALDPSLGWWAELGDARLEALITEALTTNRDLRALSAAVEGAEAQARLAGAPLKPQVSGRLDGAKNQQVFVGLPIPGQSGPLQSRSSSYTGRVEVRWEADLWGRLRSGQKAALGDLEASREDLAAAWLALSGQVARTWFALLESERQVALAADTADSLGRTTRRVEARYRQGLVPSLELRLARANEARAVGNRERAKAARDALRRQLEVLLGRYPSGSLESSGELPTLPDAIPAGLPAELVARRPDLRASEARIVAAGYRVAEARAAFYPSLTLTGSAGTSSDDVADLLDGDFSIWSLAGGLLQPIFQGGRLRAAADLSAAGRESTLAAHAQALLRAFSEVEVALGAEGWLTAEAEAVAIAVSESRAAVELAEDRYLRGVGDYLTVLESQRQAFANESALLALERQRLTNRVDLYLALGGGVPTPGIDPPREASLAPASGTPTPNVETF